MNPDDVMRRREDYEALVRAVFATAAGHALLAHWRETLLAAPTWQPGDNLDAAAFAEGRKDLVRQIDAILTPKRTA